jgi:hypothetical protein
MKYYSYAGEAKGTTDPEDIDVVHVSGDGCDVKGCVKDNCEHTVIMWSGNEYSRNNSWIAADDDHVIDLGNAR